MVLDFEEFFGYEVGGAGEESSACDVGFDGGEVGGEELGRIVGVDGGYLLVGEAADEAKRSEHFYAFFGPEFRFSDRLFGAVGDIDGV